MKLEDVFVVTPTLSAICGSVAYFVFHVPASTVIHWAMILGFAPHFFLGLAILTIAIFFGGFNNDRPPCSCGDCNSNDYQFDDALTISRNTHVPEDGEHEWCYRCPTCQTCWISRNDTFFRLVDNELVPYMTRNYWGRWKPVS